MALRNGHGDGAGYPRIEVVPIDELPTGLVAPALPEALPRPDERVGGRFAKGSSTAQRKGAIAAAAAKRRLRALRGLGLQGVPPATLQPYLDQAEEFATHEVKRLADIVGGGFCGAAPASMVQTAALQLAASRLFFATGELEKGSRLGNDSRQNLLGAHELCAREAKARAENQPPRQPWFLEGDDDSSSPVSKVAT